MTTTTQNDPPPHETHHVHFNPDDVARVEGKPHKDYPKTHLPEKPHVHFNPDDVARVEGKPHKDYPKTHKPQDQPHVHFKEEDLKRKENKQHVDFPKTHMPKGTGMGIFAEDGSSRAGKVKVSKEDFLLHLKILILFFGLFLFGTWYTSKDPWEELKKPKAKTLQQLLQEEMEKQLELVDPEIPADVLLRLPAGGINSSGCNLFLTRSSVGQSGFGIFTVVDFQERDVVFGKSPTMVVEDVELPLHAMILRQHPHFGNVKVTANGIVATRPIEAGEELFLDLRDFEDGFASVYHGTLHPSDPTHEDYTKADDIVKKVIDSIPTTTVYEQPKKKMYKQRVSRSKNAKLVPAFDAGSMLGIIKDSIEEYNPKLAYVIPDSTVKARSILEADGTANFISNHRSLDWIVSNGICISGLGSHSSVGNNVNGGAFATRSVTVEDVIETAPLYAVSREHVPGNGNCFESSKSEGVFFCPLSFVANVKKGSDCQSGPDECSSSTTNAKFEWSKYNAANKLLGDVSREALLKNPMTDFTIDLIAIRDIARDEEVYADISTLNTL